MELKSEEVIDMINSSEKSSEKSANFTQDESYAKSMVGPAGNQDGKFVKVLGVNWNTKTDEFLFNFTELVKFANTLPVTKRSLLKISAKVFDPLGFLSPYVIQLKCMFQELCAEKIDWDRELHGDWLSKWTSFLSELESLNKVRVISSRLQNPFLYSYMASATRQNKPTQHLFISGHLTMMDVLVSVCCVPRQE